MMAAVCEKMMMYALLQMQMSASFSGSVCEKHDDGWQVAG